MKLTKEQIDHIDVSLSIVGVKYLDIKLELIDHIASEIEVKIDEDNCSFNDALNLVLKKWQPQFVQRSSFWIGVIYSFPKIVLDRLIKKAKLIYMYSFVFMMLWLAVYGFFESELNLILKPFSKTIEISSVLVALSIVLVVIYINIKSKPTSFRFLVNQSSSIIMFTFFILMLDEEVVQTQFFYFTILFYYSIYIFKNFISHRNFIKKTQFI